MLNVFCRLKKKFCRLFFWRNPSSLWAFLSARDDARARCAISSRRRQRARDGLQVMPQIVRGALDIGSGQHKLLIGLVDTASRRIVQKLRTEQAQVRLGQALLQNSEGALDSAVLAHLLFFDLVENSNDFWS